MKLLPSPFNAVSCSPVFLDILANDNAFKDTLLRFEKQYKDFYNHILTFPYAFFLLYIYYFYYYYHTGK